MKRETAAFLALTFAAALLAGYVALFRPGYLNNAYLGALLFAQVMLAALWRYRDRFFLLLMVVFLWAGMEVPLQGLWTSGRWLVLATAAVAGLVAYLRSDNHHFFGSFHLLGCFSVIAAVVSALVSSSPQQAIFKAMSLLLLFLYAACGARLAIAGSAENFFSGLLVACEILTYLTAAAYFILHMPVFGNPNSLGAVMGVVVVPLLLWGILTSERRLRLRRTAALVVALFLLMFSLARAGIIAGPLVCVVLCLLLRRYKLLLQGLAAGLLLAALAAALAPVQHNDSASLASVYLYKGHRESGVLGSRRSPWQRTWAVIQERPWFGSGFGTSVNSSSSAPGMRRYETSPQAQREHGNSYLAIMEWVGWLGVLPFVALLLNIVVQVRRVLVWVSRTGSACHPSVPLAMVLTAGMVHAFFEDWLFAVGYHLCILFWVFAFSLGDLLPARLPAAQPARRFVPGLMRDYAVAATQQ